MSLADLRKELKQLRKSAMPTPVSRMKKTDCVREIERIKGIHHAEVKKVEEVMKKEEVAKPVAKKVKEVQEKAHAKAEEVVKKEMPKKETAKKVKMSVQEVTVPVAKEEPMRPSKYVKGSQEAKDKMAAIRQMRKKKDE
jgi:hypothetical protein